MSWFSKLARKGMFGIAGKAATSGKVQDIAKKVAGASGLGIAAKNAKGIGDVAKKAVKAVVKYNPLTLAARGGFLVAMKLNLGKMANKLKWGYGTPEQARVKGVAPAQYQKSKTALTKVENLFADKLQGSREVLKNAILKGRAGNLSGDVIEHLLGYLGDPVTASAIAAATA